MTAELAYGVIDLINLHIHKGSVRSLSPSHRALSSPSPLPQRAVRI
jgi:hypothetical protein